MNIWVKSIKNIHPSFILFVWSDVKICWTKSVWFEGLGKNLRLLKLNVYFYLYLGCSPVLRDPTVN